jgi:hypothetical protein
VARFFAAKTFFCRKILRTTPKIRIEPLCANQGCQMVQISSYQNFQFCIL